MLFKWMGILGLGAALLTCISAITFAEPELQLLCIICGACVGQFSLLSFILYTLRKNDKKA